MKVIIESTDDGSPTLYRQDIDEHYHSIKGAMAESRHVYVDCGWKALQPANRKRNVFEVGFGTGLNAALTSLEAVDSGIPTSYTSVELYPPDPETLRLYISNYPEVIQSALNAVNDAPWDEPVEINQFFTLHKIKGDILSIALPSEIDVVYYDAFAPEKQPDIWREKIFRNIHDHMNTGAVLTTYCAKGAIRRMLRDIGFKCERLPGPPGGKREILRATKGEPNIDK